MKVGKPAGPQAGLSALLPAGFLALRPLCDSCRSWFHLQLSGVSLINVRLLRPSLVFARLGIGRLGAAERVDITGDGLNLVWFEDAAPGQHAFLRHAVDDALEIVDVVRSMNPVIITEIRADQPAAIRAMAWRAKRRVRRLALRENGWVR